MEKEVNSVMTAYRVRFATANSAIREVMISEAHMEALKMESSALAIQATREVMERRKQKLGVK